MTKDRKSYARFAEQSYSWRYIERPALDRALPDSIYTSDTTILDIGSGTGRVINYHHRDRGATQANITGIEPHGPYVESSRKRFPDARFINAKIQDTELAPESFDLVTAQLTLHHLNNAELAGTCRKVSSALRPGGLFFTLNAHPSNHVITKGYGLEGYFDEGPRALPTPWGEHEISHYRTMSTYINTLISAELALTYFDECPLAEAGKAPEFEADLAHYSISPVRFALLATKPE